ncbi:transcriptional regulator AsnC, partial [Escherichia coli]|nr:transcriptional regulator AsnC [Escherichia coli]
MANARTVYADLANKFGVSPGTIPVGVEKRSRAGTITGPRLECRPHQPGLS